MCAARTSSTERHVSCNRCLPEPPVAELERYPLLGRHVMKAVVFHGIGDIRLENVSQPRLKEATDAIVRLTASAICGTDLHMIRGTMPGMKSGTTLGHEGVGVVEAVGKD